VVNIWEFLFDTALLSWVSDVLAPILMSIAVVLASKILDLGLGLE